jgi:hypothetical protein
MANTPTTPESWIESVFAQRDETLYPQFFNPDGPVNGSIYRLSDENFRAVGAETPDQRLLLHGVFEFAPTADRPHWVYASSGMSNPWGQTAETAKPDDYSGLGYEFVVHTRERGRWPIQMLHWLMTVQLLTATGHMQGELLQPHDRIPLGGSIGKKDGVLTHLLTVTPDDFAKHDCGVKYPANFQLPSGTVDFLILLGISSREADFARTQGVEALVDLLVHHHFAPFTDPQRVSVV